MSETSAREKRDNNVLESLSEVLEQRKTAAPDSSYVAKLYHSGLNKILEKVGEEAVETILAAKDAEGAAKDSIERNELIKETADLWFHTLVMLSQLNISTSELLAELDKRSGTSGLVEKAARKTT